MGKPGECEPASEPTAVPEVSFNVTDALSYLDDIVLRPEDLPHNYRIPVGDESRYTNTSVVNELGELAAKKYIVVWGMGRGLDVEMSADYMVNAAQAIYDRISQFE